MVIVQYKGKGHKMDSSSCRPISLKAVACKILKHFVVQLLHNFLISNDLICREQHGLMPNRSTTTNLQQCDTIISDHLNANEPCDALLLDFRKTVDKVSHDI